MWYSSNFLKVILLGKAPGHLRFVVGSTVTPNIDKNTTQLDNPIHVTETPFSIGGGLATTYQYLDNPGGQFTIAASNAGSPLVAPATGAEVAFFYQGWMYTVEGGFEQQTILLFHSSLEGQNAPHDVTSLSTVYTSALSSFLRAYTPSDETRIVPIGLSGYDVAETVVELRAKLTMAANSFTTTPSRPDLNYLGNRTFDISGSTIFHAGTSADLSGYYSGSDTQTITPTKKTTRFNEDGTVTFTVNFPIRKASAASISAGRIQFTVGYMRFDLLLPAIYPTNTGEGNLSIPSERWQTLVGNRDSFEIQFTLGDSEMMLPATPATTFKLPTPVEYLTRFRRAASIQAWQNASGGWVGFPAGYSSTASTTTMLISKGVITPAVVMGLPTASAGVNLVRLTHKETGAVVFEQREMMNGTPYAACGVYAGEYTCEVNKAYSESSSGAFTAIGEELLESTNPDGGFQQFIDVGMTQEKIDNAKVFVNGEWVPMEVDKDYLTQFGSKVSFNPTTGMRYTPMIKTSAYNGMYDSFQYTQGNQIQKLELPTRAKLPVMKVINSVQHARLKTKYWETTQTTWHTPQYSSQNSATIAITVPTSRFLTITAKNNQSFGCRVELYDSTDQLIDSVSLGASILPEGTYTFDEIPAGTYKIVYTSIGKDFETDKRPYITLTRYTKRYDLLQVISALTSPAFSMYPTGYTAADWKIVLRWNNGVLDHTVTRVLTLQSGRLTLSKEGMVTFQATVDGVMAGIEDFGLMYDLVNKTTGDIVHCRVRLLAHPDIDMPTSPHLVVVESDVPDGLIPASKTIQLKTTVYPESRGYTTVDYRVLRGSATVDETGLVTVGRTLDPVQIMAIVDGRGCQVNFLVPRSEYMANPEDVTITTEKITATELYPLNMVSNVEGWNTMYPRWTLVGNPEGVGVTNAGQVKTTIDRTDPFKVRGFIRGIWVEKELMVYPPIASMTLTDPGVVPAETDIQLTFTVTPINALLDGETKWEITSGVGRATISPTGVLRFNAAYAGQAVSVRVTHKGKSASRTITSKTGP